MRRLILLAVAAWAGCTSTSSLGRRDSGAASDVSLGVHDAPLLDTASEQTDLDAGASFVDASFVDAPFVDAPGLIVPDAPLGRTEVDAGAPTTDSGAPRSCSLLLQDCGEREGCYTGRTGGITPPACYPAGTSGHRGVCDVQNDCAPGHVCLAAGERGVCHLLCRLGGGRPGCPGGYTCNDLGVFGAGYCEVSL